jgi:hypothetical protein
VYEWVSVIGNALSPVGATSAEWIGMLLEVVTGIEHPTPLNDLSDHTLSRSWQIMPSTNTSLETTNVTDVFGTQANGIALVSDFLIKPTMQPSSLIQYHVQYGQILDFPTDDYGYIRAAKIVRPIHPLPLKGTYRTMLGKDLLDGIAALPMRLDVEPHWEADQRLLVLRARRDGVVVSTISAELISRRIHYATRICQCRKHSMTVNVDENEHWNTVTVGDILGSANGARLSVGNNGRVYVDTSGDETARLVCAGLLECRKLDIVQDCLSCAYGSNLRRQGPENATVIIG